MPQRRSRAGDTASLADTLDLLLRGFAVPSEGPAIQHCGTAAPSRSPPPCTIQVWLGSGWPRKPGWPRPPVPPLLGGLLHDRSVLRQSRIADRICRRSCLHDCTPLHAASDVSDVLSPLTVACFRRAAPPGVLRRLGGDPVLGIGLSPSTLLVRERRPVWRFILWSFTDEPRRNGGVVRVSEGRRNGIAL